MGRLDHLKIGMCGDLKFGRTVHSLVQSLSRYEGNEFVFISPEELRMPEYMLDELPIDSDAKWREERSLEKALPELDILYMTRVQQERFFNEEDYLRLRDSYILNAEKMQLAKSNMAVLHPLPRINEISRDVDLDSRAAYFEQVQNGVYVRMALLMSFMGLEDPLTGECILG